MPTILDSVFTGVANTSSTPIGREGGGGWVATKWQDMSRLKAAKWHPLVLFLPLHITQSS